jgi:acyl-CoA dehydrogenase
MVPNSLGPAELVSHYGTHEQKEYYLPRLASGRFVPCFGLTGVHNGSDAIGQIDKGIIKEINGKLCIEVSVNKRYITLAPVANCIGLALQVEDPDKLLPSKNEGISVALLENDHPGLIMKTHHNPLDVGFPNGTIKGNIVIPVDSIIGGQEQIGNGWKMLMECLAAGRGICLPASALASSKVATTGIWNYALHRKQFKMPLLNMEGVQEKIINALFHTWCIETSVKLTNELLDSGAKPAVLSAIMKQQSTERGRIVLNEAMDIHAGSSICLGENNFTHQFYKSAPIGITVEGSNTLTRSLIIFGQGMNKSHPVIENMLKAILDDSPSKFQNEFIKMTQHSIRCYINTISCKFSFNLGEFYNIKHTLESQMKTFAHLSNVLSLRGGKLKREQMLSGKMADLMSNLYIGYCIFWYNHQRNIPVEFTQYCLKRITHENSLLIQQIIRNLTLCEKLFTFHIKENSICPSFYEQKKIITLVKENPIILDILKEDVFMENNILEKLNTLSSIDDEKEYKKKLDECLQVGEYKNI